jgi:hypothetical protein|nr:MAG TPA: hypothetical protein [Caudoviricetes sp.]
MLKTYRNPYSFTLVIGSYAVRAGETIELTGYNGSMLVLASDEAVSTPAVTESVAEEPVTEEKSKRARKAAVEPEVE